VNALIISEFCVQWQTVAEGSFISNALNTAH